VRVLPLNDQRDAWNAAPVHIEFVARSDEMILVEGGRCVERQMRIVGDEWAPARRVVA
jgi:hypothetical protein